MKYLILKKSFLSLLLPARCLCVILATTVGIYILTQPFVDTNTVGTSGAGHCIRAWCCDAIQLSKYSQVLWHNDRVRSLAECIWKT